VAELDLSADLQTADSVQVLDRNRFLPGSPSSVPWAASSGPSEALGHRKLQQGVWQVWQEQPVVDQETAHVVDRETAHVVAPVEFLVGTLLAISVPGSAGEHRDGSVCPG